MNRLERFRRSPLPLVALLLFLSSPLIFAAETEITPLDVTFVDVGHGDCIWIRTPDDGIKGNGIYEGYNIIIDGGPSSQRIKDIMLDLGLRWGSEIEWMINTHAHNDHYRGLIGMLEMYRVKRIIDPGYQSSSTFFGAFCWVALIEPHSIFYFPAVGIPSIPGTKSLGQSVPLKLDWGEELDVEILYSNPAVSDSTVNDSSLVIRMEYGDVSFLFTGDLEGKYRPDSYGYHDPDHPIGAERYLLDSYVGEDENRLRSTILKIPHHGSETSSTNPYIEAVAPKEGIIMAGNRHGLPDGSLIKRYESHGVRIWRTDRLDRGKSGSECHGDDHIVVTTDGKEYEIRYLKPDPVESAEPARIRREAAWKEKAAASSAAAAPEPGEGEED
jgi:competence protein ComEC